MLFVGVFLTYVIGGGSFVSIHSVACETMFPCRLDFKAHPTFKFSMNGVICGHIYLYIYIYRFLLNMVLKLR